MKIGIIVAMEKELRLLLHLFEDHSKTIVNKITFHTGSIGSREVVATQCGIGKVNAALSTRTLIETFSPALIINTGVAGGAGNAAGVLDVVVGDRVAYHDVWCGPDTEWGQAAGCPLFFEAPEFLTSLPALNNDPHVRHGLICSGDIFVSTPEVLDSIRSHFPDVMAVDMESAAVAHTCYLSKVPFISIRIISDTPGADDNISQYENFWNDAPKRTFKILENLLAQV